MFWNFRVKRIHGGLNGSLLWHTVLQINNVLNILQHSASLIYYAFVLEAFGRKMEATALKKYNGK